jgi:hypothetical protein
MKILKICSKMSIPQNLQDKKSPAWGI